MRAHAMRVRVGRSAIMAVLSLMLLRTTGNRNHPILHHPALRIMLVMWIWRPLPQPRPLVQTLATGALPLAPKPALLRPPPRNNPLRDSGMRHRPYVVARGQP